MSTALTYVVDREGLTADLVALAVYGRTDGGIVEQVLAANPGLCNSGVRIPVGTAILMPEVVDNPSQGSIALWN